MDQVRNALDFSLHARANSEVGICSDGFVCGTGVALTHCCIPVSQELLDPFSFPALRVCPMFPRIDPLQGSTMEDCRNAPLVGTAKTVPQVPATGPQNV